MTTLAELLVKVGVDVDGLGSGIEGEVDRAERGFKQLSGGAERAGLAIDQAGDRASRAFTGVDASAGRASTALRDVASNADRAGSEIAAAGSSGGSGFSSGLSSSLGGVGSELSEIASSATDGFQSKLAAGGVLAGAALIAGLSEAADREAQGDVIAARLGLTPEQSAAAGRAAGNLYANAYGESFGQVSDAVDAVWSSLGDSLGPADDALERTTAKALDLSTAFGVDVVETAGIAGFAVENGLANDATHAFDLITVAMQRMPASMRAELFPAIEEYGSFLHNLGFTGEEAFGLLAAASAEGSFGIDKTADALKELTIRATDMSTTSVAAFDAAGLDAEEMAGRFLAGGDSAKGALDDLIAGLLGIEDPVERSNAAIGLFGTPLEDLSVTEIPQFLSSLTGIESSLGNVGGAAENMGTTLNENAATKLESFKRKALDKLVTFLAEHVIPALEKLSQWAQNNPGAFQTIAAIIAGVLVVAFIAWAVSAGLAAIATLAATWPIVLAILAVIVVVALLVIFWDVLKGAAVAAWNVIWGALKAVFNWIRDNWPLLLAILTGPIGWAVLLIVSHWDKIRSGFTAVKDWIGNRVSDIAGFFRGLWGRISGAIDSVKNGIKTAFTNAKDRVREIADSIVDFIKNIPERIGDIGGRIMNKITSGLGSLGSSVGSLLGFDIGGIVPGRLGAPQLAVVHGGETIVPTHNPAAMSRMNNEFTRVPAPAGLSAVGSGMQPVVINVAGSIRSDRDLIRLVRDELDRGGLGGSL